MKTRKPTPILRRLTVLAVALALLVSMFCSAYASGNEGNEYVRADRNGVLCIEYGYVDNGNFNAWGVGSAFMINENTLLTCYHCVHFDEDEAKEILEKYYGGYDAKWKSHMAIQVVLANGTYITAVEQLGNAEVDFSILNLQGKVANHQPLALRTEPVSTSTPIYALGFPYEVSENTTGTAEKYTAKDVTVVSGSVSNAEIMLGSMYYLQHNAVTAPGCSGGPLVDSNGAVVGVNRGMIEGYHYATSINQVILSLDALGIDYTVARTEPPTEYPTEGPTQPPVTEVQVQVDKSALTSAISTAQSLKEEDYTTESWSTFAAALLDANSVNGDANVTQERVDNAVSALNTAKRDLELRPAPGINPIIIVAIAVAVVVLIVVIVLVVSKSGKKEPKDNPNAYTPPEPSMYPPQGGGYQNNNAFGAAPQQVVNYGGAGGGMDAGATGVLDSGAGGTTVLSGAADTTVLSGKPYALLTRKASGETATADKTDFVIGRERRNVDYYVSNTAVGRTHCKLTNENGKVYVIDVGSKNGTFVNGVKCAVNVKTELKNGDKLTLADEDFDVTLY